jgi:hypothetical protein
LHDNISDHHDLGELFTEEVVMNGDSAKGLVKWLIAAAVIVVVCTALVLHVTDLANKTQELRVERRISLINADVLVKTQGSLDKLTEVTLKTYQTESLRMIGEIKALRDEIISLKQELRECVGKEREKNKKQ